MTYLQDYKYTEKQLNLNKKEINQVKTSELIVVLKNILKELTSLNGKMFTNKLIKNLKW